MGLIKKRRRGTAIIDTPEGILVTAGQSRVFLLPGGGANKNESRIEAAIRETKEETGLNPYYAKILFRHKGRISKSFGHGYFRDFHTVCLIKANGQAHPKHEIKYLAFYKPGFKIKVSHTTKEIIERYYLYKNKNKIIRFLITLKGKILDSLN
jgi:8-oxo-dGTP diphosphatase